MGGLFAFVRTTEFPDNGRMEDEEPGSSMLPGTAISRWFLMTNGNGVARRGGPACVHARMYSQAEQQQG